jgi:pimeloyl-ACP methyl ester carboxylesterase
MSSLNYKNVKINYTSQGKGIAVVLLHGFLENLNMWRDISKELSIKYRVISIDLLGHGKTDNLGYVHTMEEQAKMVKFILNHLKLRKYILIGHSMGGYISLAFAELYPENLKGICLMNSSALPDSKERKENRDRAVEAVKYKSEIFVKMAIPNLFAEYNRDKFNDEIDQVTKEALQISTRGIIAALEGLKIRSDYTYLYDTLKIPIQMIIGKKDPALDYESLIEQTKDKNVYLVEFPDGHMSHFENRNELNSALKLFIKLCYKK